MTEHLTEIPKRRRTGNQLALFKNFDTLVRIYKNKSFASLESHALYISILADLYDLFGISGIGKFIKENAQSAYFSTWLRSYIAGCIRQTADTPRGLVPLSDVGNIFQRRLFRTIDGADGPTDLAATAELVENGELLYSAEVFFWSLALAGIRHYGNDYGFFGRLSKHPEFSSAQLLQLTGPNQDSYKLFAFEKPRSFYCQLTEDSCRITHANRTKITRIDSLPAVYLHLGQEASRLTNSLLTGILPRPLSLEFGKVYSPNNGR